MSEQESILRIHFRCLSCKARYTASPQQAGKEGTCKNCGSKITVPKLQSNQQREVEPKFWGSAIVLVLGILAFLGSISEIATDHNNVHVDLNTGLFMILGALAYKSIKKRKYGLAENTFARRTLEISSLLLILVLLFSQKHYPEYLERYPTTNFVIPLAILLACGTVFFRKKQVPALLSIFLGFMLLLSGRVYLYYQPPGRDTTVTKNTSERKLSDQNKDYLINSINSLNTRTGRFEPDSAQNNFQSIMSEYMQELNKLFSDINKEIAEIGPIEFSTFDELSLKRNVLALKNNLRIYGEAKKRFYDKMDVLLRTTRKRTGTGVEEQKKGRLGGTLHRSIELLEQKYVVALSSFYDFVLKHHDRMTFTSEQIYMEEDALVEDLNRLWNNAVETATNFTKAQEMGTKTMSGVLEQLKEQD